MEVTIEQLDIDDIVDSITSDYLWPALRKTGMLEEEVQKHRLWLDTTPILQRKPDN